MTDKILELANECFSDHNNLTRHQIETFYAKAQAAALREAAEEAEAENWSSGFGITLRRMAEERGKK